jgi:hypothetical protein
LKDTWELAVRLGSFKQRWLWSVLVAVKVTVCFPSGQEAFAAQTSMTREVCSLAVGTTSAVRRSGQHVKRHIRRHRHQLVIFQQDSHMSIWLREVWKASGST